MQNKKGFTLVEILAVVVILAIIISIAMISGTAIQRNSLERIVETKIEQIEQAAILYGQDNPDIIVEDDNCKVIVTTNNAGVETSYTPTSCVTITAGVLIDANYIDTSYLDETSGQVDLINDVTKKSMREDTVIIYRRNNRIYSIIDEVKSNP